MVNKIFQNQIGKTMEIYIDDMIIKSVRAIENVEHLRETFEIDHTWEMISTFSSKRSVPPDKKYFVTDMPRNLNN